MSTLTTTSTKDTNDMSTSTTNTEAAREARAAVADAVAVLNEALGLTNADHSHKVTFGYIGNCSGIPGTPAYYDGLSWSVFLPHPGRVGKYEDRIGSVSTDDVEGFAAIIAKVEARTAEARTA